MAFLSRKEGDLPRRSLWQRIKDVALMDVAVLARGGVNDGSLEQVEEILLQADFGVPVTLRLVDDISRQAERGRIKTSDEFKRALSAGVDAALRAGNADPTLHFAATRPTVILVIGVNGAGKTTFIGKLATLLRTEGKSVVVGAADTFRAGRSISFAYGPTAPGRASWAALPEVIPPRWPSTPSTRAWRRERTS